MATTAPSRSLSEPTLADVLAAVEATDPPKTQRQNLASAVRTVARLLGRPPELIPADPQRLAQRLQEISPLAAGLSTGRWANVRSLLNRALAMTRPMLPGRHRTPLSAAWQALYDGLPQRGHAIRLSRPLHWLSDQGIEPLALRLEDLERFAAELQRASLAKRPEQTWREIAWVWNKVQRATPAWPTVVIPLPQRRQTYTFPWSAFPASLKADVDLYLNRLSGTDLLAETPFRPVRASTRDCRERQLRTFASALVRRGRGAETLRSLADLVALDAFKDGLRFLIERRNGASSSAIEDMAAALKAVAKHYVKLNREALDVMTAIVRKVSVKRRGMTTKNRDRLHAFEDPDTVLALLKLPARLMREAATGQLPPRRAALLAQTAVAIEILIMAPIRLGNLVKLDLDRHLVQLGRARDQLHLVFAEAEVKNDVALDHPLPDESAALIAQYVEIYLPLLAGPGNRALFPGAGGGSKSMGTLRGQIVTAVFRYTGARVHPHLFRHIDAKLFLDAHPGGHGVVTRLLGHKSMDTALTYYSGMETAAAARHFTSTIVALRHGKKGAAS